MKKTVGIFIIIILFGIILWLLKYNILGVDPNSIDEISSLMDPDLKYIYVNTYNNPVKEIVVTDEIKQELADFYFILKKQHIRRLRKESLTKRVEDDLTYEAFSIGSASNEMIQFKGEKELSIGSFKYSINANDKLSLYSIVNRIYKEGISESEH